MTALRPAARWAAALVETWPADVTQAEPPFEALRDMARRSATELDGTPAR